MLVSNPRRFADSISVRSRLIVCCAVPLTKSFRSSLEDAATRAAESGKRCTSRRAESPILSISGVPPSACSPGFAVESILGARPARSRRYTTEHSAQAPVWGHAVASVGAAAVAGVAALDAAGAASRLLHANPNPATSSQRLTSSPRQASNRKPHCRHPPALLGPEDLSCVPGGLPWRRRAERRSFRR